jgi:hypothetical protein
MNLVFGPYRSKIAHTLHKGQVQIYYLSKPTHEERKMQMIYNIILVKSATSLCEIFLYSECLIKRKVNNSWLAIHVRGSTNFVTRDFYRNNKID